MVEAMSGTGKASFVIHRCTIPFHETTRRCLKILHCELCLHKFVLLAVTWDLRRRRLPYLIEIGYDWINNERLLMARFIRSNGYAYNHPIIEIVNFQSVTQSFHKILENI